MAQLKKVKVKVTEKKSVKKSNLSELFEKNVRPLSHAIPLNVDNLQVASIDITGRRLSFSFLKDNRSIDIEFYLTCVYEDEEFIEYTSKYLNYLINIRNFLQEYLTFYQPSTNLHTCIKGNIENETLLYCFVSNLGDYHKLAIRINYDFLELTLITASLIKLQQLLNEAIAHLVSELKRLNIYQYIQSKIDTNQ